MGTKAKTFYESIDSTTIVEEGFHFTNYLILDYIYALNEGYNKNRFKDNYINSWNFDSCSLIKTLIGESGSFNTV